MTRITWPLTIGSYVISALPVFWLGYIVIYFFTHKLGLFPMAFGFATRRQKVALRAPADLRAGHRERNHQRGHPVAPRGDGQGAGRGLHPHGPRQGRLGLAHAFKEGLLIPVTEIVAAKIPFILGGAVIVEQVFNWPGMGRMAWQAAQDRDFPVIMGIAILAAVFVRMGSLFQSVVYVAVNPRASKE